MSFARCVPFSLLPAFSSTLTLCQTSQCALTLSTRAARSTGESASCSCVSASVVAVWMPADAVADLRDRRVHLRGVDLPGRDAVGDGREQVVLGVARRRHLGVKVALDLLDLRLLRGVEAQRVDGHGDEHRHAAVVVMPVVVAQLLVHRLVLGQAARVPGALRRRRCRRPTPTVRPWPRRSPTRSAIGAAPPLEEPLSQAINPHPLRRRSPATPPWFHRIWRIESPSPSLRETTTPIVRVFLDLHAGRSQRAPA